MQSHNCILEHSQLYNAGIWFTYEQGAGHVLSDGEQSDSDDSGSDDNGQEPADEREYKKLKTEISERGFLQNPQLRHKKKGIILMTTITCL